MDVVHDFGLEESLSGVVHDLVAELGFGNVLAQLLDTGALGSRAVLVDDLIALALRSLLSMHDCHDLSKNVNKQLQFSHRLDRLEQPPTL